jgi:2-amino-4-hydroxy-6-hydroxymethyldihydropteridine diphosphokinase
LIAHINIGSNLGNRTLNIQRAVAMIANEIGTVTATSSAVDSEPWGFDSPNRFINVGVNVDTQLSPAEILSRLKAIERDIAPNSPHRDASGAYADRCIDLDLIAIDSLIVDTPSLQLPHPQMHLRSFVLQPLAEIWPTWQHPTLHATAAEILHNA